MNTRFLVGSRYFFENEPDYNSKDYDYVDVVDNPLIFKNCRQLTGLGRCVFEWRRMSADEFVEYTLTHGPAMSVGKFLVPEFVEEIGFTIEHLKKLKPVFDALDREHQYEHIIFEAYLENGKFELKEWQKAKAYQSYVRSRNNNIKKFF